nr:EOG090X0515 [Ilyocryptus agilis]
MRHVICMVSDFFYPGLGGVESHIFWLSQCLLKLGHKIIVITRSYGDRVGVRYVTNGLKVYYIPIKPIPGAGVTLPTVVASLPLLRYIFIREEIEIIHGHSAFSTLAHEAIIIGSLLGIKVNFLIGGDGPKRILLEHVCEREGIHDRVSFLGALEQPEVHNTLLRGHIFLNTSLTEAFCIAIVEAASCGLQVVSTKVGGVPEVLPPEMIWLAEPNVSAIVSALDKAISSHMSGTCMSPWASHEFISKAYSWFDVANRTQIVYDNLKQLPNLSTGQLLRRYRRCGPICGNLFVMLLTLCHLLLRFLDWLVPRGLIDMAPVYDRESTE